MAQYCCIEGCGYNNELQTNSSNAVTFHGFPKDPELKRKWLQAIGLPDWEPPSNAKICSVHFDPEQIKFNDEVFPVNMLPAQLKYENPEVEVCRICLATDLKMYRLSGGLLKMYTELTNINELMVGLPEFLCYECAGMLVKCNNLIEKSLLAQTTLLEIYAENGQITKEMIKELDRNQLNLASSMVSQKLPKNIFEFKYDDQKKSSYLVRKVIADNNDLGNEYFIEDDGFKVGNDYNSDFSDESNVMKDYDIDDNKSEMSDYDSDEMYLNLRHGNNEGDENDYNHKFNSIENTEYLETGSNDENIEDESTIYFDDDNLEDGNNGKRGKALSSNNVKNDNSDLYVIYVEDKKKKKIRLRQKNKNVKTEDAALKVETEEFFDIIKLSPEEQLEEWNQAKVKEAPHYESVFECLSCPKIFTNHEIYKKHMYKHKSELDDVECPVCKVQFNNEDTMRKHVSHTHEKKYHCKKCPKIFNNEHLAKKHQKWHEGYKYICPRCPYVASQESSLTVHLRMQHPHVHICSLCGRTFASMRGLMWHINYAHKDHMEEVNEMHRCEPCNVIFSSEEAKLLHLRTSARHNDSEKYRYTPVKETKKTKCKKCNKKFETLGQLFIHKKTEHPHSKQRTGYRLPTDNYPCTCEHCDQVLNNRREHYVHYVKKHPKEKYKPVILATCKICGKGYQSTTKLQIHELHHSSPTVRCGMCPRIFHDKYALTRHMTIHNTARPFQCSKCSWSFKQKCNLHRHELRVHSMERPYKCGMCDKYFKYTTSMNLHIRTVHYKIPLPPRKKRPSKANKNNSNNFPLK